MVATTIILSYGAYLLIERPAWQYIRRRAGNWAPVH
jgi:hypothetical protein